MIKAICWVQICSHDFVGPKTRSPASEALKPSDSRALKILRMWCHPGMGGKHPNIFNENHILPSIRKNLKKTDLFPSHEDSVTSSILSLEWTKQL